MGEVQFADTQDSPVQLVHVAPLPPQVAVAVDEVEYGTQLPLLRQPVQGPVAPPPPPVAPPPVPPPVGTAQLKVGALQVLPSDVQLVHAKPLVPQVPLAVLLGNWTQVLP